MYPFLEARLSVHKRENTSREVLKKTADTTSSVGAATEVRNRLIGDKVIRVVSRHVPHMEGLYWQVLMSGEVELLVLWARVCLVFV